MPRWRWLLPDTVRPPWDTRPVMGYAASEPRLALVTPESTSFAPCNTYGAPCKYHGGPCPGPGGGPPGGGGYGPPPPPYPSASPGHAAPRTRRGRAPDGSTGCTTETDGRHAPSPEEPGAPRRWIDHLRGALRLTPAVVGSTDDRGQMAERKVPRNRPETTSRFRIGVPLALPVLVQNRPRTGIASGTQGRRTRVREIISGLFPGTEGRVARTESLSGSKGLWTASEASRGTVPGRLALRQRLDADLDRGRTLEDAGLLGAGVATASTGSGRTSFTPAAIAEAGAACRSSPGPPARCCGSRRSTRPG